jgi:hypothetical protein
MAAVIDDDLAIVGEGRRQSFRMSHAPAGDGKGGGQVDAQAVAASELHVADQ